MHTPRVHPGCAQTGTSHLSSVLRWTLLAFLALAASSASALTTTYTFTGRNDTQRFTATFTVDDQAYYYDLWGYRSYVDSDYPDFAPRAITAGEFTVRRLDNGAIVQQGVVDRTWSRFEVLDNYGSTDWLTFVFNTADGFRAISVYWDWMQDIFSSLTPPTRVASPFPTRIDGWMPEFNSFLQSCVFIVNGDVSPLLDRIAALETRVTSLQAQLATAQQTVATLNQENAELNQLVLSLQIQLSAAHSQIAALRDTIAALQTELAHRDARIADLQTQLAAARTEHSDLRLQLAARDATIAGLRGELATAQSQIAALQGNLAAAQGSLTRLNTAFRATFANPTFVLPGADANAQLSALIDGILGQNRGSQQQLYFQLTGKK